MKNNRSQGEWLKNKWDSMKQMGRKSYIKSRFIIFSSIFFLMLSVAFLKYNNVMIINSTPILFIIVLIFGITISLLTGVLIAYSIWEIFEAVFNNCSY